MSALDHLLTKPTSWLEGEIARGNTADGGIASTVDTLLAGGDALARVPSLNGTSADAFPAGTAFVRCGPPPLFRGGVRHE